MKRLPNGGFTLIELLVAMGISSLVFLLVSSLLVTVITSNSKNERQEAFEQVKNDLGMEISNAVRWGESVAVVGNQLIVDGTVYSLVGGRIWKNSDPLTQTNVEVKNWEVKDFSNFPGRVSVEVKAELDNKQDVLVRDQLRVVVSQRKMEVSNE